MDPTTADIKSLLNTEKIKDDDNDNFDEIDDLMSDDIIKNYKINQENQNEQLPEQSQSEQSPENDDNGNNQYDNDDPEPEPQMNQQPNNIDPNDFKEMLEGGDYENLTPQQQKIVKYDLLMKMAELVKQNGIQITTDYNMNSDYYDIKREYDYHIKVRGKKRAISTIYSGVICASKALEFLNNRFNPFGVNINGFSFNLEASREEMLDVLTELYDKYFGTEGREMTPEMQFLLIIIKALILTMVTNYASSYMSSLFSKSLDKEEIKKEVKQNNNQSSIPPRSTNVMEEYNKEVDLRNVKLTPIPDL